MKRTIKITGKVFIWGGEGPWYFVHIDRELSATLRESFPRAAMIPVEARIGSTAWQTSLFRSNRDRAYILPIKKAVRAQEGIYHGDEVSISITLR